MTRPRGRPPAGPLLACLLALLGCAARGRAGAIIEVTSDLAVPTELDRLLFRVTGAGPDQEKIHDLAGNPDAQGLPARFGIEGERGQQVKVTVVGRRGGLDVISRSFDVTLSLPPPTVCVALPKACVGARGPAPEVCAATPQCQPPPPPDASAPDAAETTGTADGAASLDTPSQSPDTARAWTQIVPDPASPAPEPRGETVMVVDSTRHKLILFGGRTAHDESPPLDDLWELDLATLHWAKRGPTDASAPWPRSAEASWWPPAVTYDEGRGRLVCYGLGARRADNADLPVWEWDASTGRWSPGASIPRPRSVTEPTALLNLAAARDVGRSLDVLLVRFYVDASPLDATYEAAVGQPAVMQRGGSTPSLETLGSGLFYDPLAERVRMLRYATVADRPALQVWTWASMPGPPAWQNDAAVALDVTFLGGNQLRSASWAFEAQSGRVFFYSFPAQADFAYEVLLWSARLQTGAIEGWSSSGPQPLGRQWPGLVADPATGILLMFGGYRERPMGDLWRWDPRAGTATTLGP